MIVWTLFMDGEEGPTCNDTESIINEMELYAEEEGCETTEIGRQKFQELLNVLRPDETAWYGIWQVQCHEMTREEYEAIPYWHCY